MSYFNSEQESYLKYLASLPVAAKCECGWYHARECTYPRDGQRAWCPYAIVKSKRDGTYTGAACETKSNGHPK